MDVGADTDKDTDRVGLGGIDVQQTFNLHFSGDAKIKVLLHAKKQK